jgi:hypothetical protein
MLNLVLKDFRVGLTGSLFLLWLVFFMFAIPSLFTAGILSAIFISIVIGLDERTGIDTLYCSFPLKRSTYVLSKYLFTFAVLVTSLLFVLLIRWLIGTFFYPDAPRGISIQSLFYLLFPLTILFSIYFPVHFKMGSGIETSARFIVVLVLLVLAIGAVGYLVVISFEIEIFKIKYIYLYLTTIMILFAGVSLALSVKFFSQRELS